eukprot:TRINITY_DN22728_c1_g1_i2.p1 TRINITY_DN22728_c1_g1~~TRINITY_DN22728_c1_g1_i2.p1  ORF type:complete len:111 (+),score=18.79 TRINITY_DN22728_c1_g1_i2:460-792(+)
MLFLNLNILFIWVVLARVPWDSGESNESTRTHMQHKEKKNKKEKQGGCKITLNRRGEREHSTKGEKGLPAAASLIYAAPFPAVAAPFPAAEPCCCSKPAASCCSYCYFQP